MKRKVVQLLKSGDFIYSEIVVTDQKTPGVIYNYGKYTALWDTGANRSSISTRVADELNLKPNGKSKNITPNAITDGYVFTVSFILEKEDISFLEFDVLCDIKTNMPHDVIIGMDIISLGTFNLTKISDVLMQFTFEVDY